MTKNRRHAAALWLCAAAASLAVALPAQAQDCEVKIGAVGPHTGGAAAWGLAERAGVEFEAAWVNSQGGLGVGDRTCQVRVVSFDSLGTAAGGAAAANYLASQRVAATVGPIPTTELTGFLNVARRQGIVNFSTSFGKTAISADFPLAFQKVPNPNAWGESLIASAREILAFATVAVVSPNDQGGQEAGESAAHAYEANGVEATLEYYQRGTSNFSPIVTRLMGQDPDVVELVPMSPGEATILVKQLLQAGYEGSFGRLGSGSDVILAATGGAEAHHGFFWVETVPTRSEGIQRMNAEFEDLMGQQIPSTSVVYNAQIAAETILRAISDAGDDQDAEAIARALRDLTPRSRYLGEGGWRGISEYGINQQLAFPIGMGVIVDGKEHPQTAIPVPAEAGSGS